MLTLASGVPAWVAATSTVGAHKATHENGGGDEISVASLSGLLADDQHVLDAEVVAAVDAGALTLAGGVTMASGFSLVENLVVLDGALSGDETWSGVAVAGTAGVNVVVGDLIFLDTDDKWSLADADQESSAFALLGITLTDGGDTDGITVLLKGFVRADTPYEFATAGVPLYISATDGDVTATAPAGAGDIVRVAAYATANKETIYFDPGTTFVEIAA